MRVLIAGGTGFIGRALARHWRDQGAEVTVLSRRARTGRGSGRGVSGSAVSGHGARSVSGPGARSVSGPGAGPRPGADAGRPEGVNLVTWDDPSWRDLVAAADAVVNLAGATIGRRWSRRYRQVILDSRLWVTRALVDAVAAGERRPKVFISGSAVGYYGVGDEQPFTEENAPGDDFLATVCARWEAAARPVEDGGVRLVLLRTGLVLGRTGGMLPRILIPFRLGLGGPLGDGRQWMSWIHVDDICRLILFAATREDVRGPLNATAPTPVTNETFTRTLAEVLRRPAALRVPAGLLRLVLGDAASLLLEGQRVLPRRALASGFRFRFEHLDDALRDLLLPGRRQD